MTTPDLVLPSLQPWLDALPDPGLLVGAEGQVRSANPAAARYFGTNFQTLPGRSLADLWPELAAQLRLLGTLPRTFRLRSDGAWSWTAVVVFQVGALRGVQLSDATAQQAAEVQGEAQLASTLASTLALSRSEERYRALTEVTNQYAWTNSPEGEMVGEQPGWARLTGQTRAEYQGYGWSERLHPDDREGAVAAWHDSVRACSLYQIEQRVRVQGGSYRSFLVRSVPLLNEDGGLREWVGLHTDVTDLKQAETLLRTWGSELERQVATQTRELLAANEELGAFAHTVSHDLRAPVRHVASFAGLLRQKVGDDAGVLRYVDVIEQSAQRMNVMIDALLGLARTGAAELRVREVDLTRLVDTVRSDLALDLSGRKVIWTVGELPAVQADPRLLRQVFDNLLGNAVKYSRGREHAVVSVSAEQTPTEVTVAVRDNGAGFDPQSAGKLFGVFQRLHSQKEFEGTGVGLANVRRIVEKHGGRVWAEGQPGAGATFFFSLPST